MANKKKYLFNVNLAMRFLKAKYGEDFGQEQFCEKYGITYATYNNYKKNNLSKVARIIYDISKDTGLTLEELVQVHDK